MPVALFEKINEASYTEGIWKPLLPNDGEAQYLAQGEGKILKCQNPECTRCSPPLKDLPECHGWFCDTHYAEISGLA